MTGKLAMAAALLAAPGAATSQVTIIAETQKTVSGQPLHAPPGAMALVATRIVLAKGAAIDPHMHLWPRYVYVESGEVRLTLLGTATSQTFTDRQMIVEPIGKWHSGVVTRDAVLIAIEQVPPGRCNTIKPPVQGKANDC